MSARFDAAAAVATAAALAAHARARAGARCSSAGSAGCGTAAPPSSRSSTSPSTGLSGPDVPQIRDALTSCRAGDDDAQHEHRRARVGGPQYAYVQSLTVTRHGAHDVVIRVTEQVPVALVDIGGEPAGRRRRRPAAARARRSRTARCRSCRSRRPRPVRRSRRAGPRAAIAVLAAAPYALLAHIASATSSSAHGVIVQLRNGPQLYFGPTSQLAAEVAGGRGRAAEPRLDGASYIDVS